MRTNNLNAYKSWCLTCCFQNFRFLFLVVMLFCFVYDYNDSVKSAGPDEICILVQTSDEFQRKIDTSRFDADDVVNQLIEG